MVERVLLIDGHNLLFRYFHGMPKIAASDGRLIHGAYGMITAILRTAGQWSPAHLLVCFDTSTPSDRVELSSEYKSNRTQAFDPTDVENNPFTQLDIVKDALGVLSIPWIEARGVEADDLIGSYLCAINAEQAMILSNDRDFLQLVGQTVFLSVWRGKAETRFDQDRVQETFGILPNQFVEYRALTGDTSDNIRGIPGIGPKTAARLLQQYGSLEKLYHHLDELKPRVASALKSNSSLVNTNLQLLTIRTDIQVDATVFASSFKGEGTTAQHVFQELGLFRTRSKQNAEVPLPLF